MKLTFLAVVALLASGLSPDPPHVCDPCDEWNVAHEPFRIHGDTWFVGTAGLGAILIASQEGHILIDGGLPQSAALIAENIRKAGYRLEDIKLILNSHTHYDHAGGIAALQRATGARVAASPASKRALERGGPTEDDPQFAFGREHNDYAPVRNVREIRDGETLRVAASTTAVTAHFTPGHTPGGTTWTWRACEATKCLNLVYGDSLNSVSAPGFKFDEPTRLAVFERSIARVEALPCDILITVHPTAIDMDGRLAKAGALPLLDPAACRHYAAGARQRLQQRVTEERATKP
jgi:metallo-beta-lactamase class B